MDTQQLKPKERPEETSQRFFFEGGWPQRQVSLTFPTSAPFSQLVGNYAQLVVLNSPSYRTPDRSLYVNLWALTSVSQTTAPLKIKVFFLGGLASSWVV